MHICSNTPIHTYMLDMVSVYIYTHIMYYVYIVGRVIRMYVYVIYIYVYIYIKCIAIYEYLYIHIHTYICIDIFSLMYIVS